jgi:hypothetical protein
MGLPGAKPKADRSQIRHRVPTHIFNEYPNVPFEGAPPLPNRGTVSNWVAAAAGIVQSDNWPRQTQDWYRAISRMPHAREFSEGDWQQVFITAEVHARTYEGWKGYGGTELRQREAQLGTTMASRLNLRIRYVDPPAPDAGPTPDNVTRLDDFRDL